MAKKSPSPGHQDIVERLLEGERAAKERAAKAREEAQRTVEGARRDAESHVKEAERKAREEADRLIDEARQASTPPSEQALGGDVQTLRRHARENMEHAVDAVVNWVTAGAE